MDSRETAASELGALVRQYRQRLGLSQEALAERSVRLSVDTIANIEQGRNRPYRHTLDALAEALGLDAEGRAALHAARAGKAVPPAPPAAPAPPPAGLLPLPVPLTRLLGREHDEAAVAALLRHGGARLVTLTGPGGVGKTRLALQVAPGLADAFPDGVAWIDLAPVRDPARVLPALAHALGVREDGGGPVADRLAARLRGARLLLALDNLEQVVEAAPALAALLAACPGVAVLATSRAALRVRGEHEYPVTPLPAPPPQAGAPDLAALARAPAVALFLDRGQAARPDLALTDENAAAVVALCARLDGLPLALELAAARLALFSPQALLARLDRRLPLLVGGPRDLPARQRTLQGAIAWSYDLLPPAAQALFRQLGVFAGGCTVEAVEALWPEADPAASGAGLLDELAALRDQSLVRLVEDADGEPRVLLLETLHEYAQERLAAAGEVEQTRRRHAAYFLALAQAAAAQLRGDAVGQGMRRLGRERENLHAALAWACAHGEAELAQRIGAALGRYWYLAGQAGAGRRWLETALALPGPVPAGVRAAALERAAMLARGVGDRLAARDRYEAALALYEALGDTAAGRELQLDVEELRIEQEGGGSGAERRARQRAVLEQERVRCERAGDTNGAAVAVLNMGRLLLLGGERETAEPLLAESLALAQRHGHLVVTVYALLHLGLAALHADRWEVAQARYGEALRLAAGAGDRVMMTYGLEALVGLAATRGAAPQAARLAGAAAASRARLATPLAAEEQALYEGWVAAARARAEPRQWEAAWGAGQAETLEDAVAAALGDLGPDEGEGT